MKKLSFPKENLGSGPQGSNFQARAERSAKKKKKIKGSVQNQGFPKENQAFSLKNIDFYWFS